MAWVAGLGAAEAPRAQLLNRTRLAQGGAQEPFADLGKHGESVLFWTQKCA